MFSSNFCDFYLLSSFYHGGISLGPCWDAQTLLAPFFIYFSYLIYFFSFSTHYYLIFYSFYFLSSKNVCYSKCLRPQGILFLPETINCHIIKHCLVSDITIILSAEEIMRAHCKKFRKYCSSLIKSPLTQFWMCTWKHSHTNLWEEISLYVCACMLNAWLHIVERIWIISTSLWHPLFLWYR